MGFRPSTKTGDASFSYQGRSFALNRTSAVDGKDRLGDFSCMSSVDGLGLMVNPYETKVKLKKKKK